MLGPYTVNITNGTLAITTTGGAANLSGLVVERATAAPANRAPVVTSPGNQTSTRVLRSRRSRSPRPIRMPVRPLVLRR